MVMPINMYKTHACTHRDDTSWLGLKFQGLERGYGMRALVQPSECRVKSFFLVNHVLVGGLKIQWMNDERNPAPIGRLFIEL